MRTLYLHIGFHKTGSSSLQLAMKEQTQALNKAGFEFLSLGKKGNSSGCIEVLREKGLVRFKLNSRLDELLAASRSKQTIVSAEHLCFLHQHESIELVQQVCAKYFDNVKVIVYLRRQDLQAISFKKQGARGAASNRSSSSKLLGHSEGAFPTLNKDIEIYYDYFSKLKLWETVFGTDSLKVRLFGREALNGGDIVSDFFSLLDGDVKLSARRVNEGVDRKEFLLTHKLLELGVAESELIKLKPMMLEDHTQLLPSRDDARQFFLQFKASNQLLNSTFLSNDSGLAFDTDFSVYPEQGNDWITVRDLSEWIPEILSAGIQKPEGLRDALLADKLQQMLRKRFSGDVLTQELENLAKCLSASAYIAKGQQPWYRALKKKKTSGR
ncbi:hypothetical protein ACJJIW_01125 [Microbulbifer sp. JMSA004]|uniref:hypothetical protein n=1 Tax=unclassified Microbulbifer TaxID=2619833 RepID=UPI0024AE6383|nr:hypothetical protein [Microbulbifer sp. VAAF005]WHI48343.1 hypothetical protein P0078_08200 [Microbulbifer sp. VAAF005]